jgi:hypothetical protein
VTVFSSTDVGSLLCFITQPSKKHLTFAETECAVIGFTDRRHSEPEESSRNLTNHLPLRAVLKLSTSKHTALQVFFLSVFRTKVLGGFLTPPPLESATIHNWKLRPRIYPIPFRWFIYIPLKDGIYTVGFADNQMSPHWTKIKVSTAFL